MNDEQSEALRLADALLMYTKTMRLAGQDDGVTEDMDQAAAELRRLYALCVKLQRALGRVLAAVAKAEET